MKNIFEHQLSDGALPFLPSDEDILAADEPSTRQLDDRD